MWNDNWVTFLDTMLQIQILSDEGRGLRLPTRIRSMRIDPATHADRIVQADSDHTGWCARRAVIVAAVATGCDGG